MSDDVELLRRYAKDGCAKSFELIVRRHIGWVYSASLRQLGDAALAEDVTQSVFVLLERKAATFKEGVTLSGWLFNTLRFASREARRKDTRRRKHEAKAAVPVGAHASNGIDEAVWEKMSPLLEEAVGSLDEADRQAVLLRFYEGSDFAAIGTALGVTEVTARKRVSRAVQKLGAFFKQKGVIVPAVLLASALFARAAEAAPGGLVEAVLSGAGANAPAVIVGTLVRETAMRFMKGRRRLAAAIVACMGLLGIGLWVVLVAWMVRAPLEGEGARTDLTDEAQGKWEIRPRADSADDFDFARPRPSRGYARFDFGHPAPRPAPPEGTITQLDATWWVRQWYDLRNAVYQPSAHGPEGAQAEEELVDPRTGLRHPRSWFEENPVPSFDVLGGVGGSGGGGSARADAHASAPGADAAPSRSTGLSAPSSFEGAAIAAVVVASDSSATSTAADSPALAFVKDITPSPSTGTFIHIGGNDTFGETSFVVMGGSDTIIETGGGPKQSLAIIRFSTENPHHLISFSADVEDVSHWFNVSDVVEVDPDGHLEVRPGADLAGLSVDVSVMLADLELYRSQNRGALPERLQFGDVGADGRITWSNVPEPGAGLLAVIIAMGLARRRAIRVPYN